MQSSWHEHFTCCCCASSKLLCLNIFHYQRAEINKLCLVATVFLSLLVRQILHVDCVSQQKHFTDSPSVG